jgi:hypothetical protein
MILRMLIIVIAIGSNLSSTLYAGAERGEHLVAEAGGVLGTASTTGIPGVTGIFAISDFFALMPFDNAAPVAAGAAVMFPENGAATGAVTRLSPSSFMLPAVGTYLVEFQVSVTEAGQLMLRLNGGLIANSVVGRATGTDQIVGISLVTTTAPNSVLEVINPPGNSPALTITPFAGSTPFPANPVSAHLVIIRIQ